MAIYRITYRADSTSESWDIHRGRNVDQIMYPHPMIREEGEGRVSVWVDVDTVDAASALLAAIVEIKEAAHYCDNLDETTLRPKIERELVVYTPKQPSISPA